MLETNVIKGFGKIPLGAAWLHHKGKHHAKKLMNLLHINMQVKALMVVPSSLNISTIKQEGPT